MGLRDIPIKNEYRSLIDDVIKIFMCRCWGTPFCINERWGSFHLLH